MDLFLLPIWIEQSADPEAGSSFSELEIHCILVLGHCQKMRFSHLILK